MVEEIARERRCDPLDAVCDVIIADKGATRIVVRSMSEADVRAIAADPSALVGSDGPCVAPYGVTGQGKPSAPGSPTKRFLYNLVAIALAILAAYMLLRRFGVLH